MKKIAAFGETGAYTVQVVTFDDSNEIVDVDVMQPTSLRIDYAYAAPDDMMISYINGDKTEHKNVRKGDIILAFYELPSDAPADSEEVKKYKRIIVISSEDWKNNMRAFEYVINNRKNNDCNCSTCINESRVRA